MSVFKSFLIFFFICFTVPAPAADFPLAAQTLAARQDSLIQKDKKMGDDPWLGADKGQHLLGSMIVTIGAGNVSHRFFHANEMHARSAGVAFTLSLGAGKEIWDYFHPGHDASWKDLTADAVGILLGCLILNIK